MAENDYLKRYRQQNAGRVAAGAGRGALKGAATGAQIGTLIPVPVVGTAIGALGGAIAGAVGGGIGANRKLSPYERANIERVQDLERRMELGQLGLTPEEKAAIFGAAEDRERRAREQARAQRGRMAESFAGGAGVAAAEAAQAEEFAVEAMRQTGQKVAEADIARAKEEEREYYDRLAAISLQEAEEREKTAERNRETLEQFNELLTSEITTSGPGGQLPSGEERQAATLAELEKQFGAAAPTILEAAKVFKDNPGLFDLLMSAGG